MASRRQPSRARRVPAPASGNRARRGPALLERRALVPILVGVALLAALVAALSGSPRTSVLGIYLAGLSALCLGLFGLDKALARAGRRRVSERNLLLVAGLGGALGALLGMVLFRHKTRHARFRYLLPAALAVHLTALAAVALWL